MTRFLLSFLAIGFSVIASISADDNVRAVQTKLKEGGFYFGEVDGAYSSDLATALTRYQVRHGLPITGQLDEETSKALGAKAAVKPAASDPAQTSETWRRLRKGDEEFLKKLKAEDASATTAAPASAGAMSAQNTPTPNSADLQRDTKTASSPAAARLSAVPIPAEGGNSSSRSLDRERIRDYIAAFVLAGLDPRIGAELEFFGDRVRYYNEGVVDRDKIRRDLQRYAERWPERHFWLTGDVKIEPQTDGRLRVTFPLRYELRNASKHSSGQIQKTLLLEAVGEDLQIVAVNEAKARE